MKYSKTNVPSVMSPKGMSTAPIRVARSLRPEGIRGGTSCEAGKVVPLKYFPLFREDALAGGRIQIDLEMAETAATLMNPIKFTVQAHFISTLAAERFTGMDQFNASYMNKALVEGDTPVPFFETTTFDPAAQLYSTMGIHMKDGDPINTILVESYNILVNYLRKMRSVKLPQRLKDDTTLAAGLWTNNSAKHIVPDFDQAAIDGEVELNITSGKLPVTGIGKLTTAFNGLSTVRETGSDDLVVYQNAQFIGDDDANYYTMLREDPDNPGRPGVFAELEPGAISVSLAKIKQAKQTAEFAKLREQYKGHDDAYIVDLLMQGVRVPDLMLEQPIHLATSKTIVGYTRQPATDGASLGESVTYGETSLELVLPHTAAFNTGGIVLITAVIEPEQLFERRKDYYLSASSSDDLPNFLRDYLDPEKVDVIRNDHVDVDHQTASGTFGYAPLNTDKWRRDLLNLGGKFYRPDVTAPFDEDRQRFWAVETPNPTLTEDFYLMNDFHHNVFKSTNSDPFEITFTGLVRISGTTVFGQGLEEDSGQYEYIDELNNYSPIDQVPNGASVSLPPASKP